MKYSKEEIEEQLKYLLDRILEHENQDGSILNVEYNESDNTVNIKMTVHIEEKDDFIGFQGY